MMLLNLFLALTPILLPGAHAQTVPNLNGQHFKITVAKEAGFVDVLGTLSNRGFSGYCIGIIESIARADRANFTYEFVTPSGTGSLCGPVLDPDSSDVYGDAYLSQYMCGQSDVNDLPATNFTTDMYMSLYYVTPERQLANQFSLPFQPPTTGTLTMFGTATGIATIQDLVNQQDKGTMGPACTAENAAYISFLQDTFPSIQLVEIAGNDAGFYAALLDGTCTVSINDNPIATQFVLRRASLGQCTANGKPIGVIGDPLGYGLNQYAIGIRSDISLEVVNALSYWMNILMTCSPGDAAGDCPADQGGNLAQQYGNTGGTGAECRYVLYPQDDQLSTGGVAGITIGCSLFCVLLLSILFWMQLKKQEKRYKTRFVRQVARNISIAPSPGMISADKLTEELKHIGGEHGRIAKAELKGWLDDKKLGALSDGDFEALWAAMDTEGKGEVDPVEFFVFLSACGPQFEEVYNEQRSMPRKEKIALASRRLSNISYYNKAKAMEKEREKEEEMEEAADVSNSNN
jgi:hypothetical protein